MSKIQIVKRANRRVSNCDPVDPGVLALVHSLTYFLSFFLFIFPLCFDKSQFLVLVSISFISFIISLNLIGISDNTMFHVLFEFMRNVQNFIF